MWETDCRAVGWNESQESFKTRDMIFNGILRITIHQGVVHQFCFLVK